MWNSTGKYYSLKRTHLSWAFRLRVSAKITRNLVTLACRTISAMTGIWSTEMALVFSDHWQGSFQRGQRWAIVDPCERFAVNIHLLIHQLLNIQQQNIEQQHLSQLNRRQLTQINNILKYVPILIWTASVQTSGPPLLKKIYTAKLFSSSDISVCPTISVISRQTKSLLTGWTWLTSELTTEGLTTATLYKAGVVRI